MLPKIISSIDQPCLFWLDAHYSGGITAKGDLDTPVISELIHIFSHPIKGHVILIDDALEFTCQNDYPLIEDLKEFVLKGVITGFLRSKMILLGFIDSNV